MAEEGQSSEVTLTPSLDSSQGTIPMPTKEAAPSSSPPPDPNLVRSQVQNRSHGAGWHKHAIKWIFGR